MSRRPEPVPPRTADPSPSPAGAAKGPAVWAVAGGKGGVGRSLLVANMGIQMARLGKKVVAADLDFQGANLHTYLGLGRPPRGVERLAAKEPDPLSSLLLDTSVSGLKLLAGALEAPSRTERERILESFFGQAGSLGADLVLLDCGSGRNAEILDPLRKATGAILVSSPEPASVESLFLFMESFLARVLETPLSADDREKLEIARSLDEGAGEGRCSFRAALERLRAEGEGPLVDRILAALRPLRLRLIVNQVRGDAEAEVTSILHSAFDKYFGLELKSLGSVEYDLSVLQAVQKRKPLSQQYPNSPATQGIERAVSSLVTPFRALADDPLLLDRSLAELDHYRLLEVAPGTSSKEIQAGYQILKRAYDAENSFRHPLLSATQIQRIASMLESAYRTLIFLETRTEYDRRLVAQGVLRPEQLEPPEDEGAPPARPTTGPKLEEVSPLPVSGADDSSPGRPSKEPAAPMPAAQVPGQGLPVTGATLRGHRESRSMPLETIVEKTKIRPAILEALEEDRFADLPEPVFLKGFLRQLALCLGLDPAVICREYMRRIPSASAGADETASR
jgi:flagellar biosynthesis protein FlhG